VPGRLLLGSDRRKGYARMMNPQEIQQQYEKAEREQLATEMKWRRRLNAYCVVFEKMDRILSGRNIMVEISGGYQTPPSNNAVGWTDGETIWFNGPRLQADLEALEGKDITQHVVALCGVNLHELSHNLFSPRMNAEICKMVLERVQVDSDQRWWHALNILEDCRAETLYAALYRPAVRYFEAIALKWLMTNQQAISQAHVLVYGRKFLPKDVRKTARLAFRAKYGKALEQSVCDIVNQYLTVVYNQDTQRALSLVRQLREVLKAMDTKGPVTNLVISGHITVVPWHGKPTTGKGGNALGRGTATVKAQRKARDAATDKGWDEDDLDDDADGEGEGQQGTVGKQETKAASDNGTPEAPDPEQKEAGSGDDESDAPTTSTAGGNGISSGPSGVDPWNQDAVDEAMKRSLEAIQEAFDKAMDDKSLKADVKETIKALKQAQQGGDGDPMGGKASFGHREASGELISAANRTVAVLKELMLDLEPTWHKRETSGHLDIRRVLLAQPHELDLFNRWDEGSEDEGGVEVVICIDQSSSMSWKMDQASQALWAVKRSFDELDIRTTVIGYNDTHKVLMYGDEMMERTTYRLYGSAGSTDPGSALTEAIAVLMQSDQQNRVLISITDGGWGNPQRCNAVVQTLNELGCVTILLGLDQAVQRYGLHDHEFGGDIAEISELPTICQRMVAGILTKAARR
jgi:hypothetical protein